MNTEDLGNSKILNLLFKPAGVIMESRLRQWLLNPVKTLRGAGIQPVIVHNFKVSLTSNSKRKFYSIIFLLTLMQRL
ncbi:MAG TPA: hypothetical protein ENI07_21515 [Desulfobacterales bacterium]|nr:hypothetical protein [Desulfobacterales bacterium]